MKLRAGRLLAGVALAIGAAWLVVAAPSPSYRSADLPPEPEKFTVVLRDAEGNPICPANGWEEVQVSDGRCVNEFIALDDSGTLHLGPLEPGTYSFFAKHHRDRFRTGGHHAEAKLTSRTGHRLVTMRFGKNQVYRYVPVSYVPVGYCGPPLGPAPDQPVTAGE